MCWSLIVVAGICTVAYFAVKCISETAKAIKDKTIYNVTLDGWDS